MRLPSKITSYSESVISKFPAVLSVLQDADTGVLALYLRDDVTDAQIIANLLSNPVKALIESGFFFYNEDAHVFSVSPDIWSTIDISNKAAITRICRQKLKDSYKD